MSYSDDENRPGSTTGATMTEVCATGSLSWTKIDASALSSRRPSMFIRLSHAMQNAMSWRGWVLKTMKVWKPKQILLRTHHGMDFQVKLYKKAKRIAKIGKHFARCMVLMRVCLSPWILVILQSSKTDLRFGSLWIHLQFFPHNVRKMVDKTHYTDGSKLTYREKNHLIAFCTDLENYNVYNRTPQHYGQYMPLVHVLNYGNYHGDTLIIPNDCVPHLMYTDGSLHVLNIQPGLPTNLNCPYRVSKRSEDMTIKEWRKCMDNRKELLGSKRQRSARIGDRMIFILHNGESGSILFYAILP
ncbi:hypothetical protein VPH35_011600 [Triticum aestivum]